ncbi:acetate--CoA ligase family protein [Paraburkholderia aspalathi]|uniref:Acyl-CoA synthetase (NDP forming) n=1 Tax=Paraburkholderia aspalathi TaxID=1324617 RepID=A0A1I7DCA9_9BURK|nr:acetate--CoA ligase family protein [Paraburkholderia aspalathi]SFU09245.1 Acyl-CoA synthetase (NDP forming) [Paraburkholderia aspalathi]
MTRSPLDPLFRARSVALIGVSGDPKKMTGAPLQILRQTGFTGEVYPVNPKRAEVQGMRAYPRIDALPAVPDVAMIMLPASACAEAVRECAAKGIRACVIPSSGFEETDDGETIANDLKRAAEETGVVIVGPNCEGLWSVRSRLLLTFGSAARRDQLHHAPIAILSQSGAMAGALARHLQDDSVGCAYVVSVGNETVLTISDYLEWMIEQDDVEVVTLFIEGLRDGKRLLNAIERATAKGMRIVALKSGNTHAGAKAAASHTGKIASASIVYQHLLRRAGAVLVDSLTDLIAATKVLAIAPLPPARGAHGGVSVFSIPGGTRAMTADHLDAHGVALATFTRETVKVLTNALPEFGGVENPTDLTGQVLSHPGLFDTCLRAIAGDPNSEALIVQVANRGPRDVMERVDLLGAIARDTNLPIIATFLGDALSSADQAVLRAQRIVCARDPAEAARYLGWLFQACRRAEVTVQSELRDTAPLALPVSWPQMADWLAQAGCTPPPWRIVGPGMPAGATCQELVFPVAVKALPEDSDHKTELGLLALNVRDPGTVDVEAERIRWLLGRQDAGVLVQQMAAHGVEAILAAMRDPDFGPVMAIGLGGTAIELFGDVGWLTLPTDTCAVREALKPLRLSTLLAGFRGKPAADIDALVQAAVSFGDAFLATTPAPFEIEINPLIVLPEGQGVVAVDALFKS